MKGGVVLADPTMTHQIAFMNFITHCPRVRILTDTSRSSITLYFMGCPPEESPYRHTRISHGFRLTSNDRRVTQCIVKLVLLHPVQQIITRPFVMSNYASYRTDFLLETAASIDAEVNIQYGIHNQSLFPIEGADGVAPDQSYFAPVCPAIINYITNVGATDLDWFRGVIMNKLQPRVPVPCPGEDPAISARRQDRQILDDFFTFARTLMPFGGGLGMITMEIMSNCTTLHNYLEQPGRTQAQRQFALDLAHIQMIRLGAMGIVHADCHSQNIMVNTTVRYLPEPHPVGNAFLIDFGAVRMIQPTWDIATIMGNYQCYIDPGFPGRVSTLMRAMQQHNRALLDQARQQIVPRIATATVDEFIADLRQRITARFGNVAPHIAGGGRISTKNKSFSNKKMTLDEFVDMIINDMKPPVKIDLRGTMKRSPLNKSRRRRSPSLKRSPLNKSRRSPSPKRSPTPKKSPSPNKSPDKVQPQLT